MRPSDMMPFQVFGKLAPPSEGTPAPRTTVNMNIGNLKRNFGITICSVLRMTSGKV